MPLQSYEPRDAALGSRADSGFGDAISAINANPQTAQVLTLTLSGGTGDADYALTLDGLSVAAAAENGDTDAERAEFIAEASLAEPLVNALFEIELVGATVVFTSRRVGVTHTFAVTGSGASIAETTAAAEAQTIAFGFGCVRVEPGDYTQPGNVHQVKRPEAGDFAGGVAILTFTEANSQPYGVGFSVDGVDYSRSVTSDGSATKAEIATLLQAALNGVGGVVAAVVSTEKLSLTGPAGSDFRLGSLTSAGGGAIAVESFTAAEMPMILVAEASSRYCVTDANGRNAYDGNSVMTCGRDGRWHVYTEAQAQPGNPVYMRIAASGGLTLLGAFSPTSGTGKIKVPGATWHKPVSAGQAIIQLNP
jgi:hypothetical protein